MTTSLLTCRDERRGEQVSRINNMKTCFKCGRLLPISDFYEHPAMSDGHLGKCKECARSDVRANRAARRKQYAAFEVTRNKTETRKAYKSKHCKSYRARNPEKTSAHQAVSRAIARGSIIRPRKCDECGAESDGTRRTQIHAHHDDYSRPLDVRWLCPSCHVKRHAVARFEQGERQAA